MNKCQQLLELVPVEQTQKPLHENLRLITEDDPPAPGEQPEEADMANVELHGRICMPMAKLESFLKEFEQLMNKYKGAEQ
jgi:hypothetical protein